MQFSIIMSSVRENNTHFWGAYTNNETRLSYSFYKMIRNVVYIIHNRNNCTSRKSCLILKICLLHGNAILIFVLVFYIVASRGSFSIIFAWMNIHNYTVIQAVLSTRLNRASILGTKRRLFRKLMDGFQNCVIVFANRRWIFWNHFKYKTS